MLAISSILLSTLATASAAVAGRDQGPWGQHGAIGATPVATVTEGSLGNFGSLGRYGPSGVADPMSHVPVASVTAGLAPNGASTSVLSPSSSATAVAGTGGSGYIKVVNKWRQKMGMRDLAEDSTLQGNADKTAIDGNGQMVHELNPETMAQVLAPGSPDEFEKVFVGGWLCERPTLPGLDGICSTMSQGWEYNGETGHADILTSAAYSRIGCANADGIWACDLA